MSWKLTNGARWLEHTGDGWNADPLTEIDVLAAQGGLMPETPSGPMYGPGDASDERWLFLAACVTVPRPWTVTGDPPPAPPLAELPEGATP